ncbi:MAG: tetratricopeptide repeat protein, partial [Nitrospirota bacterium]
AEILEAYSGPKQEAMGSPSETAAEQHMPIEINTIPDEPLEEISPARPYPGMTDEEFTAKKAEADFYAQQGLMDEAAGIYESIISAFPDNKEIAAKLASLKSADKQEDDGRTEASDAGPAADTAADDDLQALFAEFEAPKEKKIDYEAHYVAGLEFKRKGHLDEAIKQLQTAVKDPDKFQRNTTMLALCYTEKKSYPLAIAEFTKVLDTMTPEDSTYLHVKYELANAHMNNQQVNRALELYYEIHELNPEFKDVSAKMASIKRPAEQPEARENTQKQKKDRVSYI